MDELGPTWVEALKPNINSARSSIMSMLEMAQPKLNSSQKILEKIIITGKIGNTYLEYKFLASNRGSLLTYEIIC